MKRNDVKTHELDGSNHQYCLVDYLVRQTPATAGPV